MFKEYAASVTEAEYWSRCTPKWIFRDAEPPVEIRPGKKEQIVGRGEFFADFFNKYLQGYLDRLPEYYPEGVVAAQEIVPVLQEFLPQIKACPFVKQKEIISGVAYSMLYYHITQQIEGQGRLPHWHWDLRPKYAKEVARCRAEGRERAAEFLESLSTDTDIDEKWGMNGHKMRDVVTWLYAGLEAAGKYELSEVDTSATTSDTKIRKDYHGVAFDLVYSDNIRIRFIGGPLPHSEQIDTFSMWIYDRKGEYLDDQGQWHYGKRLFHFEARNIPRDAYKMVYDLRGGWTFGQDLAVVHTDVVEGELRFAIPRSAVESLLYQDKIIIKPDRIDPRKEEDRKNAQLTETPARLARMRLGFDLGFVWVRDETENFKGILPVPHREFVWPWLLNLLELDRRMRELDIYQIGIDPRRKLLLAQELYVAMDMNPWFARQFIEYSGLYLHTGWREKTPEDLDRILASPAMIVEPMEEVAGPREEERRSFEFQDKQMRLYLAGDIINGVDRLMEADNPTKEGREVEAFLDWIEGKRKEKIQVTKKIDKLPVGLQPQLKITIPSQAGQKTLYILATEPLSEKDKAEAGHELEKYALPDPDILTKALQYAPIINDALKGTLLGGELIQSSEIRNGADFMEKLVLLPNVIYEHLTVTKAVRKQITLEQFGGPMQRMLDTCVLVEILNQYPRMTPRTLENIFKLLTQHPEHPSNKEDEYTLERRMFDLFSTGLVIRTEHQRIDKNGKEVPVEYLTLREPFRIHRFSDLSVNKDFQNFWVNLAANSSIDTAAALTQLEGICNKMVEYRIPSVQMLGSMSEQDWVFLRNHINIQNYLDFRDQARMVLQVAKEFLGI